MTGSLIIVIHVFMFFSKPESHHCITDIGYIAYFVDGVKYH